MTKMRSKSNLVVYADLPPKAPVQPGDSVRGWLSDGATLFTVVGEVLTQEYDEETETSVLIFEDNTVAKGVHKVTLSRTPGVGIAMRPLPLVEVEVYWGEDGTPVVEVDTPGIEEDFCGPLLRVYLNDSAVYANPELED